MRYVTTRVVEAIQWNGAHTLEDVQKFLAGGTPAYSPYWVGTGTMVERLAVPVRDHSEDARWPTLSPHYTMKHLVLGDWILRDEAGNLSTLAKDQFEMECQPVPEAAAASLVAAMAAMNEPDVPEPTPELSHPLPVDDEIPL